MILLLGASGYVGRAFAAELHRRSCEFIPLTRSAMDYSSFNLLFDYLRRMRPAFLINAAGFTGSPTEEACEFTHEETLAANTLLPQTIARACLMTHVPWGHVSSGGIYSGAKIVENGRMRIERGLNRPEVRRWLAEHPETLFGFNEWDEPNFSFRCPPCGFYFGTKALAEEAVREIGPCYLWRPGLPFNERPEPRNFLWRLQQSTRLHDRLNSWSHVDDFARACLDLWERQAAPGIYNVANPDAMTTRQVVELVERILKPNGRFEFSTDPELPEPSDLQTPRPHCVLDVTKLRNAGIAMRPVEEALEESLRRWQRTKTTVELACQ